MLQRALAGFNASVALVLRRPRAMLLIIALSALGQFMAAGAIGLLARELDIGIPVLDIIVVTFGATLAATIPISIAGWGIRDGALIVLFGLYGVPPQTAFAVSILFGVCLIIASTPGIIVFLNGTYDAKLERASRL